MPRKSVVRLTDRPDMTLDVYRGRETTTKKRLKLTLTSALNRALLWTCIEWKDTVFYPVSNISQFRTFVSLTRFPDTETDTWHKTYHQS